MALKSSLKVQENDKIKIKYIVVLYQVLCPRVQLNALKHRPLMLFAGKQDILGLLSRLKTGSYQLRDIKKHSSLCHLENIISIKWKKQMGISAKSY